MPKALFIVSAADGWTLKDGTVHPTGYWAEELSEPHRIFSEAGWDITIATPGGVKPTVDQVSLGAAGGLPNKRKKVEQYLQSIDEQLSHPQKMEEVNPDDYDLVFYPGGHGPMEDLAYNETSGKILTERLANGRPLALLCHAPAAILAAKNADGTNAFAGRRMTGFSNNEEKMNKFAKNAKWYLEDAMKDVGVDYHKALLPFASHVEVDGSLYTGQNPKSAEDLAKRILEDVK